jgi:hypothetical protein
MKRGRWASAGASSIQLPCRVDSAKQSSCDGQGRWRKCKAHMEISSASAVLFTCYASCAP